MYYPLWQQAFFIVHDFASLICMVMIMTALCRFRERKRAVTVVCLIITLVLSVSRVLLYDKAFASLDPDDASVVTGLPSILIWAVIPFIITKPEKKKRLRAFLLIVTFELGVEGILSVFQPVLGIEDYSRYQFIEVIFSIICFVAVILFLYFIPGRNSLAPAMTVFETTPKWLFLILIVCALTAYFNGFQSGETELFNGELIYNILRIVSIFGILAFAGYFVARVLSLVNKQNQILAQMSAQQSGYEKLLKSDDELRRFRHDYKNHMAVVTSLLHSGMTDEAAEYLDTVKVTSGITVNRISTGNFVADSILSSKSSLAEEYEIHLEFSGRIPEAGIENADLCTILANLTDNAIENTKNYAGNRYVKVDASMRNGILVLSVKNPVSQRVEIKNNRIKTSKADTRNHGIGLKNVASAAKKYKGNMVLECTDKEFCADVSILPEA